MSNPPCTPVECFAATIRCLTAHLVGHSMWGRLPRPLSVLIIDRLRTINQCFARIAARIAAGTYRPRRSATRRKLGPAKPRRPDPLPRTFAWLRTVVPDTLGYGSQLEYLFRDPEMAALLQAAPGSLRRPLRSLCRMLGVTPPPILAIPTNDPAPARPESEGPVAARRKDEGVAAAGRLPPSSRPSPPPPSPVIPDVHGPPRPLPA